MATVDPIVQCTACGAKLRLKAASLKVLKQVRCGKCQSMIEIPEILKSGGPFPEEPVLAKTPVSDDAQPADPAPAAVPEPVPSPVPAPAVPAPAAAPAPAAPAPAPAPADVPAPAPAPVPSPVQPPVVGPRPEQATPPPLRSLQSDSELVARVDSLEHMLHSQQESISLLTTQLRQIIKAHATAVATAQSILDR